jgi:hypothetical protein
LPSTVQPSVPSAVERVVMRALEKDRANRYQTMAEMESDIDRVLAGTRLEAPLATRRRLAALSAAVVAASIGAAAWRSRHPSGSNVRAAPAVLHSELTAVAPVVRAPDHDAGRPANAAKPVARPPRVVHRVTPSHITEPPKVERSPRTEARVPSNAPEAYPETLRRPAGEQ